MGVAEVETRQHIVPIKDPDRIQEYALKLAREGKLQYAILVNVATQLHQALKTKIFQETGQEKSPYEDLKITPKLVAHLEKQFEKLFTADFWEKNAEWIMNHLDIWNQGETHSDLQPGMLAFSPDPSFSKSESWTESQIINACGYHVADELLQQINVQNLLADELAKILELAPLPVPVTEPRLFNNKATVALPTAALMASSLRAQIRTDLWGEAASSIAVFQHQAKGNSSNYIEHYISSPGDITLLPWDEAQQIIDKFGFTSAKLHMIFAAHTMKQETPWQSLFTLKASDIVKEMGWDKNHKKTQTEKLLEIAKTAFALDCLLVKAVWIEGMNKKGQIIASAPVGRMWNVYIKPQGQLNFEGKVDNPYEIYITVQPGLWTQDFLNRAGAKSREALYQFGYLSQQVLRIDPYHNEFALRLAIHVTIESRFHTSGEYRVLTLLEAILPKREIDSARSARRKAYNLKQNWDDALQLLITLAWQIQFDPETYPERLQPENKERNPKGYLDQWLAAKLFILQPEPIPVLVASKAEPQQLKPALPKPIPITSADLRKAREDKGWNQRKLAGWLGVSQSLIAQIERGQRTISPEIEAKLLKLLEIQD
ncbi:helix-turn-helix transcriptional regulator [Microcoleus sp. herbarium2]|uniref:helix-turn-helix transcriptional regulator n=1 Tax=Microcoleus sp. herbarium2 TaxID=3055433 RepID=UPI002FCE7844